MADNITKTDDDNLADIIWFIKGWLAAHKVHDTESNSLHEDHIESLKKYRIAHQESLK